MPGNLAGFRVQFGPSSEERGWLDPYSPCKKARLHASTNRYDAVVAAEAKGRESAANPGNETVCGENAKFFRQFRI